MGAVSDISSVWTWLTGGFLATVCVLLGWFFKDLVSGVKSDISGLKGEVKKVRTDVSDELVKFRETANRFEQKSNDFTQSGLKFQQSVNTELLRFKDQIHDVSTAVSGVERHIDRAMEKVEKLDSKFDGMNEKLEELGGTMLKNEVNISRVSKAVAIVNENQKNYATELHQINDQLMMLKSKKDPNGKT